MPCYMLTTRLMGSWCGFTAHQLAKLPALCCSGYCENASSRLRKTGWGHVLSKTLQITAPGRCHWASGLRETLSCCGRSRDCPW